MSEGLDANSLKARHAPAASFLSVRALMTGERSKNGRHDGFRENLHHDQARRRPARPHRRHR